MQLCLEGYYDGCQFFRLIPDFLVQTGDPSNTGRGGESAFGQPFKDEFHSRLRFTRRQAWRHLLFDTGLHAVCACQARWVHKLAAHADAPLQL